MNLLAKIFGRPQVVAICFDDNGNVAFSSKEAKAPVVAAVFGKGVITKDVSAAGIVEKVTSDPEMFLWTIHGDKISFIRREQLAAVLKELKTQPLYIECLPSGDEGSLAGVAERFCSEHLRWRLFVENSQLASVVEKRLRLPILGVLMLLLVVNFALSSRVNESFVQTNGELAALQKSLASTVSMSDRRRAAIEGFSRRFDVRASRLSDKIAAAVPAKITLTELNIAPTIVICGESSSSDAITEFCESLTQLGIGPIRLASVEQNVFRIEITT